MNQEKTEEETITFKAIGGKIPGGPNGACFVHGRKYRMPNSNYLRMLLKANQIELVESE